jgi:hypothetical protein
MKKILRLMEVAIWILIICQPIFAQVKPADEKAANIQQLMKMMGTEKLVQRMIDQMMNAFRPMFTQAVKGSGNVDAVLNRVQEIMTEEFKAVDFTALTAGLYDKYFTSDENQGTTRILSIPGWSKSYTGSPCFIPGVDETRDGTRPVGGSENNETGSGRVSGTERQAETTGQNVSVILRRTYGLLASQLPAEMLPTHSKRSRIKCWRDRAC